MTEINSDYALDVTLDVDSFLDAFGTYVEGKANPSLETAWFNLTCDAEGLALKLQEKLGCDFFEAHMIVWSLFEDIISEDSVPHSKLAAQVAVLVNQWESEAPDALAEQTHFALEVAFACLRGFSREEGIAQQYAYLEELEAEKDEASFVVIESSAEFADELSDIEDSDAESADGLA